MSSIRNAILLSMLATVSGIRANDVIDIALNEGRISVTDAKFIRVNEWGNYVPELSFTLVNHTSMPWTTIELKFDVGGLCDGEPKQWSIAAVTSLGWHESIRIKKSYARTEIPLVGKVNGCSSEIVKAALISAKNHLMLVDGVTGEHVDLTEQLRILRAQQEADAAAEAELERVAAEKAARIAAEEERRRSIEAARREKARREKEARAAEAREQKRLNEERSRQRIRTRCADLYEATSEKKLADLTVKEEQQVRACQQLGMYAPK